MYESILETIRSQLEIQFDNSDFDQDIIPLINTEFLTLFQLGVGPATGFRIEDDEPVWEDYTTDQLLLGMVQEYIRVKIKPIFDSSTMSSSTLSAFEKKALELEQRLMIYVEHIAQKLPVTPDPVKD